MSTDGVDTAMRRFLTTATVLVGGAGAAITAVPFVKSWQPSERAKAIGAPVDVDISRIEPGQQLTVKWRGKPVWLLHRTPEQLAELKKLDAEVRDPESQDSEQPAYAKNEWRSRKPELLVLVGICTHLGCSPLYKPKGEGADISPDWPGGYFCPCHGSRYDLAGRVFPSVPAPLNMEVPPYEYLTDTRVRIGTDDKGVA
jgi:ubiquinol-cytochrome c reductase iron-sulfur subunit